MTAGNKDAAKVEAQKPLVEKVARGEAGRGPDREGGGEERGQGRARARRRRCPKPKPAEAGREEGEPRPSPIQIAEALAKDEAKKAGAEEGAKPSRRCRRRSLPPPAPKFDPKQVEALLDKRDSTRLAAAGDTLNNAASLGVPSGSAAQICRRASSTRCARGLRSCGTRRPAPRIRRSSSSWSGSSFKPDGDGSPGRPHGARPRQQPARSIAARESAMRALIRGQPFDMLKPEHYEQWKDIEITFDPRDMFRWMIAADARRRPSHDRARFSPNRHALSRRRLITRGRGRGGRRARGLVAAARGARCSSSTSPRATSSRCRSRCRISSAVGLHDPDGGRNVSQIITANLQRSGLFAPIDPAAYIEKISNIDTVPRFADWRQINAQALVTGRVDARPTAGSRPSSGCGTCSPASSCAASNTSPRRQLAAHRPHHLGCDLRAAHRREGLLRHPHRVRRRIRPEGAPRSSGSRSWIRTAPMCAISRAATISC